MNAAHASQSDAAPPASAVSGAVGLAGLAGLAAWFCLAQALGMDGPLVPITAVAACALPMILWSLLVDRVHRAPTTGLDWSRPLKSWRETIGITAVKIAGLWGSWAAVGGCYFLGNWYWQGDYLYAMRVLAGLLPLLLVASIPYLLWIDRRLAEPRDGTFAFGLWLLGRGGEADRAELIEHVRAWGVKGFFTAFMISIVPGNWWDVAGRDPVATLADPLALANLLIGVMFLVDVTFATAGYLLTLRPLDAHIRSANPYAAGWMAALICYPPFILMGEGSPLDYHQGTADYTHWLAGHPTLMTLVAFLLVGLTGIYAWTTVAFGFRFSNLTHRGILTHGPYRWSKHPAYLSKNLFWWLSAMPFLTLGSPADAIRNTCIMGLVSGVYYWRARTEERHLGADPVYRAYATWMDAHAPLPRLIRWVRGLVRPAPALAAAE